MNFICPTLGVHFKVENSTGIFYCHMEELDIKSRLSNNLKNIRKEKGLSQFELAEKANISEQTINSIESKRL